MFTHVQLVNSVVTDWQPTKGSFGHMALHFHKSEFLNQIVDNSTMYGLFLKKTFSATVTFSGSKLMNASIDISIPHLAFLATDTSFRTSHISLSIARNCFTKFQSVLFTNGIPPLSYQILVTISSNQLNLTFLHCVVQNSSGGFGITKTDSGLLDSWIQVNFQNCVFKQNTKLGSGAAVQIVFLTPTADKVGPGNNVEIIDSLFTKNHAQRFGTTSSQGRGISISGQATQADCNLLNIHIHNTTFVDNKAADGGGALYISDSCFTTKISNSTFQVTQTLFDSRKGTFVLSHSEISIGASVFTRNIKELPPSLIDMEMMSDRAQVKQLNMTVQCHRWSKLTVDGTFIDQQAKEIKLSCTSCPSSFYIPSEGHFAVSFSPNETGVSVFAEETARNAEDLSCIPCPPGANCPGNDITAKPNFWGSNINSKIIMYPCPADYCCQVNCSSYSHCSDHRTGVLCGACAEHHSLSMLSLECINMNNCNDHWLWPLVMLVVITYMAWYTFRNHIFGIPAFVASKMCSWCSTTHSTDVYYIDKGYFGIVTYFIQVKAVMGLSISLDDKRAVNSWFDQIQAYIELGLNFELSYISNDTCALKGLTSMNKMIFKLSFLFGIFAFWNIIFLALSLVKQFIIQTGVKTDKLAKFQIKLIYGLVEIIKYTYLGFTSIVFYSLTCTFVGGKYVWFYDGSVQCYSLWQQLMIIFATTFVLPYPFLIYLGAKHLNCKRVSYKLFLLAVYFPLPVLFVFLVLLYKDNKNNPLHTTDSKRQTEEVYAEQALADGFTGGFRKSKQNTQYWEAVLMLRRLLISATN